MSRMMRHPLCNLVVLAFSLGLVACGTDRLSDADLDRVVQGITPQGLAAHMGFLADDLLEGRRTGTRGFALAARYVASRMLAAGLEPGSDDGGFFQSVQMERRLAVSARLRIARNGASWETIPAEEFAASGNAVHGTSAVRSRAVFVGYGIEAPEFGWNDYADIKSEGTIVVAFAGTPDDFPADAKAVYRDESARIEAAAHHGAVALLSVYPPDALERFAFTMVAEHVRSGHLHWVAPNRAHEGSSVEASAWLSPTSAARLLGGADRLESVLDELAHGRASSFDLDLEVELKIDTAVEVVESVNVVGVRSGSNPALAGESVVLTAHLDHVGIGKAQGGDAIYNGAYDNASGVASMLSAAETIGSLRPARTVAFVATTAEEEGLVGADYLATHPPVSLGRIVANINLDGNLMLFPTADLVAIGAAEAGLEGLAKIIARSVGRSLSPNPYVDRVLLSRTDSFAFVRRGIPSIYLLNGLTSSDPSVDGAAMVNAWEQEHFHQPSDDLQQPMDLDTGTRHARAALLLAIGLANLAEAPQWVPGQFLADHYGRASLR